MAKSFVNTLDSTQKKNLSIIVDTLKNNGYTNPLTIAAICAIVSKESVFKLVRENMNYSTARIGEVWPKYKGRADLGNNPERLANEVYGGKYGNGPKDGYRYRGGGFNQLTFKALYQERGSQTGTKLGDDPDLISDATTAAKVLVYYYKDSFATLAKKGKLQKYGSEDLNGFSNLKDAICAAYHATAGVGKSVSDVKGLLTSDSLGGMTKAQANGPDLLEFVKNFTGLSTPPEEVPASDGGSTSTSASTPAVTTPKLPPDPSQTIAKIKLVKKSGPGELMGVTEFESYIGEASIEGLQFDEPGEYVIQAVGNDSRIIATEFTVTVTGDPNPKSSEKPTEEAKVDGSRPIIAQIDKPAVILPPMEFPLLDADADANIEVAQGVGLTPFLWFNGYQIKEMDIKSLSLYHEGMTPCCQVTFVDTTGILQKDGYPLDDTTFELFLNSGSSLLKSIHMRFKLTNFQDNPNKTYTATGSIDLRDYYKIKFKSYTGTSFEVLRAISQELQLGYNSNIENTTDSMKWNNIGKTFREFMSSIVEHSYINDQSFMMAYIDFYYCFNFVDVEKEWTRDVSSDVGVSSGSLSRLSQDKTEDKLVKLVLSNEKSAEGTDLYFHKYVTRNNSTAKSITKGQKTVTKYYDTGSKSFLVFDVEAQTTPGNDKVILKGKPGDKKDLKENFRTLFGGKIDLDNMHKNYKYAKVQNERNLNELNKISVDIEMSSCNFNLYKFQKINIQFVTAAESASNPDITKQRLSGDWIILEIKYLWMGGKLKQNLVCARKELEKTDEEKKDQTTESTPETKSGNENPLVEEKPPNSIYKVDETYTVKNKEGRLFTVTVQKLLENGNEIEGYVIESLEQPNLVKPVVTAATQSVGTQSNPAAVANSVLPSDPTKPKKVYKIYVDMGGVLFEKNSNDEGGAGDSSNYIGQTLWDKLYSILAQAQAAGTTGYVTQVSVLSSTGTSDKTNKIKAKREQIDKYLKKSATGEVLNNVEAYFVDNGTDKANYAAPSTVQGSQTQALSILIDDTQANIDAFVKKNGIGLKHDSKNVQATLDALTKILNS